MTKLHPTAIYILAMPGRRFGVWLVMVMVITLVVARPAVRWKKSAK